MIYLDYAANTPVDEEVLQAFAENAVTYIGNPNSDHGAGRLADDKMNNITKNIAECLAVKPSEIIYTSGASESNNLAIKGLTRAYRHCGKHIISTVLEHSSVSATLTAMQEQGYEVDLVRIGRDGKVDIENLKGMIRKDTVLVSVCWIDSELGTIQPIKEITQIVKEYPNCYFHVDATQALGKVPVTFYEGIDCMTFSAHKIYGLNGCGLLIKRKNVILEPIIHGGASSTIYRSGTPALALAASMETAVLKAVQLLEERTNIVKARYLTLKHSLMSYQGVRINSLEGSSPYFLNVSVKGVKGADFQELLDKKGVYVSVKSACSVRNTPSRAVYAVSQDRNNALSSWRISLSHLTTEEEIQEFLRIFEECIKELYQ